MCWDICDVIYCEHHQEKQNLREAQHIEDADTVLKEVTCILYDIKSTKWAIAEAVRTINDEHTSCSFDDKRQLKSDSVQDSYEEQELWID